MAHTYTIVIDDAADLLAACILDGDHARLSKEVLDYCDQSTPEHNPDFRVINGLILTDDKPDDESKIEWRGHERGWLTDTSGSAYRYAIRQALQP